MKNKVTLFLFATLIGCFCVRQVSAQINITLQNSTTMDRTNELVEVTLTPATYEGLSSLALFDPENNPVPYQALPYDNKIVFQATVAKNATAVYTLKEGTPVTTDAKTYAAIMSPTNRADIAWENDRVAHRMYSRKLLSSEPNSANGVDLWVKKMSKPVVEKMYTYSNYHAEQAEGVDAYSVGGKTLGAGGVVAYVNNKLWLHDPYDECEIITNGPLRSEFILTYNNVLIDGDFYTKTLRITTDANGLIDKAVVKFEGKIKPMKIAVGILLHTGTSGKQYNSGNVIAYAENKSEGTVTSTGARFYNGVYMPGETTATTVDNQRIIYSDYAVGSEFTYYFGGGWNIFPAGEYTKDEDWFTAVSNCVKRIQSPLTEIDNALFPDKKAVVEAGVRVNNYWIGNNSFGNNLWARSVYNMGNIDFYKVYPDPVYLDRATQWAKSNNWAVSGGASTTDADNHTAGQTYIDLYLLDKEGARDENKIKAIKAALDHRIANNPKSDEWWWIDAMLMAMPTFTRLGIVTGDTKYFNKMYALFANTRDKLVITSRTNLYPQDYRNKYGWGPIVSGYEEYCGLYHKTDHLWWRDWGFQPNVPPKKDPNNSLLTDVPKASPSGKNLYWARGNGWVLAAMARVLDLLPETDSHRSEYVEILTQMSAALKDCQREDGFWNMNLADPDHFPGQETSGTALFTYGMAWGINNGLLDRETYYPVVAKGWNALCRDAVKPSGKLTKTQNVGEGPIDPNRLASNVDFGVGAFLLAASEVVKLAPGEMPKAPEPPKITLTSVKLQTSKEVLVTFSGEFQTASALNKANYEISEGIEIADVVSKGTNQVLLTLKEDVDYGKYTLYVNNVESSMGGKIPANSNLLFVKPVPLSLTPPQSEITITAIGNQAGNPPAHVMDNNLGTRWAQEGKTGQWIKFDLKKTVTISAIDISFFKGDERVAYFDIEVSANGTNFTPVLSGLSSSGLTNDLERYKFDPVDVQYIRIVCNSNSAAVTEHWNSVTEVRVIYSPLSGIETVNGGNQVVIYPNPVTDNQLIVDVSSNIGPEVKLIICNLDGKKLLSKKVSPVNNQIKVDDLNLNSGSYVLNLEYGREKRSKVFIVK